MASCYHAFLNASSFMTSHTFLSCLYAYPEGYDNSFAWQILTINLMYLDNLN